MAGGDLAEDCLVAGLPEETIQHTQRVLATQPARERAHRLLIVARYVSGDQDLALQAYDRCRRILDSELGVRPPGDVRPGSAHRVLEERADDIRAVMDAAGSTRAVLIGSCGSGPTTIALAARAPDRVSGLVLFGTFARMPSLIDVGADRLATTETVSTTTAAALKAEARDRADRGRFFGHIANASLLATRTP
jgi:pimeloyl-ACP methyl ester carboxylesterase